VNKYKVFTKIQFLNSKERDELVNFSKSFSEQDHQLILSAVKLLENEIPSSKEAIFSSLTKHRTFSTDSFRALLKELNQKVDLFLATLNLQQSGYEIALSALSFILKKGDIHLFELEANKFNNSLQNSLRDQHYYEKASQFFQLMTSYTAEHSRTDDSYLLQYNKALKNEFWYKKLKNATDLIMRAHVFSSTYDFSEIDTSLGSFKTEQFKYEPSILLYYYIYLLFKEDDELFYQKTLTFLNDNQKILSKSELKDVYACLQNYCIRKVNERNEKYLHELFNLYKELLEKDIIAQNNQLYVFDFKNIATLGFRLNQWEWVEEFTKKYQFFLPPEYQQSAVSYNMARIAFHRNDHRRALQWLLNVVYADIYYELGCKGLLVKVYYELNEFPLLDTLIQSFKTFLNRNKLIPSHQKNMYLNFLKYTSFLVKFEMNEKKKKEKYDLLLTEKDVFEFDWLKSKFTSDIY
jgi:hypothetical protein